MKASWIMISLAILICIGACQPTSYQRVGTTLRGGYSDGRFSEDTFYVKFVANYNTSTDTLQKYLYRRAAELTVRHGFRYFAVVRDSCPLTKYQIKYQSREDAQAGIDGMDVEVPAKGTLHMTIQCFTDGQNAVDTRLIDAKTYGHGQPEPKRE